MAEGVEAQHGLAQLGAQFDLLSELLSGRDGPPDAERVVAFAARAVPHGQRCGLTVTHRSSRPATMAASDEVVERVDAVQYETGEGPCLEAIGGHDLVRAEDLTVDPPWPRFAERCVAETGIRSMFSVRLFLSGDARAALNFYADRPGTFDDLDLGTAAILAPFAAIAVQNKLKEQELGHLQAALQSSRQIGTAVGILMARGLVTSEQAFDQLVAASQHLNRKLRDVAAEVEQTGKLPEVPVRSTPRPRRRG